jgi:hypothetical protein
MAAATQIRNLFLNLSRRHFRRFRAEQNNDVADPGDQMAAGFLGQLGSEHLLLLLEIIELHFDQLVMFQRLIQGGDKFWAQTVFADFQHRLEMLASGFEVTYLRIGERYHSDQNTTQNLRVNLIMATPRKWCAFHREFLDSAGEMVRCEGLRSFNLQEPDADSLPATP